MEDPLIIEYNGVAKFFWYSWIGQYFLQPVFLPLFVLFFVAWSMLLCYLAIITFESDPISSDSSKKSK